MQLYDKDLLSMQEVRELVEAATAAPRQSKRRRRSRK